MPAAGAEAWAGYLPLAGLVFARCAGALCLAPPTGWGPFPVGLRLAVAAVLALPLALGLAAGGGPLTVAPELYLALVVRNLAAGLVLGLALWLAVWAFQAAGHMTDLWVAAPGEDEPGPWQAFLGIVAVAFFVQLNGLQWLLVFLRQSCEVAPVTAVSPWLAGPWLQWPGVMLVTALRLAAPLVLGALAASLMAATLERALVGVSLGSVAAAGRQVLVTLVLVAALPLLGAVFLGELDHWARLAIDGLR